VLDAYSPPGSPQIIRWEGPHEALIADADGVPIARPRVSPGAEPTPVVLREATISEERDLLARTVAWAVEGHHFKGGTT
jgi:hypothetical protein